MTVHSVNKRILEQQTNMTPANARSGQASDDFASLLGTAGTRIGASNLPSAEKALGKSLDRPVRDGHDGKSVDKPERAEAKPAERDRGHGETKAAERAEKPQPRDKAPVKDAKAEKPAAEADAPADITATTTQAADDGAQEVVEQPAAQAETTEAPAAAATTDTIQPTEAQPQVAVVAQPMAQTVIAGDSDSGERAAAASTTDQNAAAGAALQNDDAAATDSAAAQTNQNADAGPAQIATDAAFDVGAATAQAAGKANRPGEQQQNAAAAGADLAAQQADALAESLADTGAQLSVQVSVTNTAKAAAATTATTIEATSPLDILLAQNLAAQEVAPAGQQAGSQANTQNGGQNGSIATAAQQVAANSALTNAQIANGNAADAKPFAAALAAQMEAGNETPAAGSGQQTTNVTGLNGPSGTQAASKTAPTQAPHAARPPMATPEQVMDQVTVQIAKQTKDGHDTIKVQLKPVELGSIEVKLDIAQDGRVTGVVTTDNKETLAMMQKDSRSLEKALEDAGLKTDSGSLTFNLRENNQQANEGSTQGRSRRARAMAAGLDGTAALDGAPVQQRWSGSRSGVNIQV